MLPSDPIKHLTTCPMCNGRGYCERDSSPTPICTRPTRQLPPIVFQYTKPLSLSKKGANDIAPMDATGDLRFPALLHSKSDGKQSSLAYNEGDDVTILDQDLIGPPEKYENPHEVLRVALVKLKQSQWDSGVQALISITQISRFQPELIDSSMPIISRSICSLLKNIRTLVVRTACQVAMELFKTMQSTQRPEFDELVLMLLQKTAHMNKAIRQDANKALDVMITSIPPAFCIRIMASSYCAGHKNPLVCIAISRLIYCIVVIIGVDTLLSSFALRTTRSRIFITSAMFLVDGSSETRSNAKKLIKLLMSNNEFENLFHQDVDRKLMEKIQKQFLAIKYDV